MLVALVAVSSAAVELPVTLTQARVDITGDGVPDLVSIQMVAGRRYIDDPWCGGGDKYEGRFVIVVQKSNGDTATSDLNALMSSDTLFFRVEPWGLAFEDYNGDGRPDFNIGRYGTCSYWEYRLLTFDDNGIGRILPVQDGFLAVRDREHSSSKIRSVNRTITLRRFSNATLELWEDSYEWDASIGAFVHSGRQTLGKLGPTPVLQMPNSTVPAGAAPLKYRLGIMRPADPEPPPGQPPIVRRTSTCPVLPGKVAYEHWPFAIFQLVATDFHLVDANDSVAMVCE